MGDYNAIIFKQHLLQVNFGLDGIYCSTAIWISCSSQHLLGPFNCFRLQAKAWVGDKICRGFEFLSTSGVRLSSTGRLFIELNPLLGKAFLSPEEACPAHEFDQLGSLRPQQSSKIGVETPCRLEDDGLGSGLN